MNRSKNICELTDWDIAGFVPIEVIRTKFRVSGETDLLGEDAIQELTREGEFRNIWKRRDCLMLRRRGWPVQKGGRNSASNHS